MNNVAGHLFHLIKVHYPGHLDIVTERRLWRELCVRKDISILGIVDSAKNKLNEEGVNE